MTSDDPRGTKRTCQDSSCGERFYDLNRHPIICPVCGATYVIASSPPRREEVVEKKPVPAVETNEDAEAEDGAEVISLEEADAEVGDDDDNDTFLEETDDDDGGDVGAIVATDDGDEET
ncbi:MAG: TIGR02300 family protein [Pseudomonadota bacterium]